MAPFFSIIIPVYNVAPYLRECLDSLLIQTFTDWEAICVDDGSTDGSGEILDKYAALDLRIRVFRQANAGAGNARNFGLHEATGEFVLFMDGDDVYPDNNVLNDFRETAITTDADIIGGELFFFRINALKRKKIYKNNDYCFSRSGFINFTDFQFDWGFTRFEYRRAFLKKHEIEFPHFYRYEDPVFLLRAMVAAQKFYAMNRLVYYSRQASCLAKNVPVSAQCDQMSGYLEIIQISKVNRFDKLLDRIIQRYVSSCRDWMDSIICSERLWVVSCNVAKVIESYTGRQVMREAFNAKLCWIRSSLWYKIGRYMEKFHGFVISLRNALM